jgi:phosphatidylserine decarboxylase
MAIPFDVLIQYFCPQHLLTKITGVLAECRWTWFKTWAIKRLIRKYHVNLSEAISENIDEYPTFNSFFTRHLKPELRPIALGEKQIACPADGCVSQLGDIKDDAIFQAKGFDYSATMLLGGSAQLAQSFKGGKFATVYLAPKDYHRVHMPLRGNLQQTIYIPGDLFSVNQTTARFVPNLFARNERLVCIFETEVGLMAVILVGAMLVGSIRTVWPMPAFSKKIHIQTYPNPIVLEKGAELGHFIMGSTVIVLFGKNKAEWMSQLGELSIVKMGSEMGKLL